MTDSTQYKYVTQDSDGWIKGFDKLPELHNGQWLGNCELISKLDDNSSYTPLLVDLSTHDYEIVGGKLIAIEKETTFNGSDMQYQDKKGEWHNCTAKAYRIKPKTKTICYRTYLDKENVLRVTRDDNMSDILTFNEWVGEWQEHNVTY